MKNVFTFLLIMMFSASVFAQVIVGTDPENKNVILEEFTGINCSACPTGHTTAQGIHNSHPDDVVVIAIHTGSYANPSGSQPDYRTEWGAAIAGQTGLTGYPSATVNRHVFYGGNTAMYTNLWNNASNQTLAEASYLNVGLSATIVTSTRQLVVEVEVYYTDDSPKSTNYLSVAILQDDILGPQSGGGAGNNYKHMHMLRHLLTGQWGVEITETTEGSLYSATFLYELPDDYRDVDVVLENLDIVAFVSETHQEIISGNSAGDITHVVSNDYDAALASVSIPQTACSDEMIPIVTLKNYGAVNLTSLEFAYSVNGGDEATYSWTGNLAQNETEIVTLPTLIYTPTDNNVVDVNCKLPNGEPDQLPQNDSYNQNYEGSQSYPKNCVFGIQTLGNPEDVTWNIVNEDGEKIAEGGPYSNTQFNVHPLSFPENGCYELTLVDASGEGLSGGVYVMIDENDDVLWTGSDFTYSTRAGFAHGIIIDVNEVLSADDISIHPNPITNNANIEFSLNGSTDVNITVFDILGKNITNLFEGEMSSGPHNIQMDVNELNNGVYIVKIQMNNEVVTKKIMVTK